MPVIEKISKKYNIIVHWAGSSGDKFPQIIRERNLPIICHGVLDT
jgi:hypothetical protein